MPSTRTFRGQTIDGQPACDWPRIQLECAQYPRFLIEVREYNEEREISEQQRRWWKGVLLPSLAKDTGDSIECWETRLKLATLPDEFKPETVIVGDRTYSYVPSITKLSIKKMNQLVEGAVAKLHEWGFLWVTLPDSRLRKIV